MSAAAAWGYTQILAVPIVVLLVILVVAWRQDRRRPSNRRRVTGLRKLRWSLGSVSHRFGAPESGGPERRSGSAPGQGKHDHPTYLD